MQQQLVIQDVYTEVQKAFDHNFSRFRVDFNKFATTFFCEIRTFVYSFK